MTNIEYVNSSYIRASFVVTSAQMTVRIVNPNLMEDAMPGYRGLLKTVAVLDQKDPVRIRVG